jgi:hypothetical protein
MQQTFSHEQIGFDRSEHLSLAGRRDVNEKVVTSDTVSTNGSASWTSRHGQVASRRRAMVLHRFSPTRNNL